MHVRAREVVSIIGLSVAALAFAPREARAQTPAMDQVVLNREAARALAEKGLDLATAGKHAEALDLFEQAEARFHAPTHVLFAARALEKLGRLAQAEARYEKCLSEKLPDYVSDVFREAQAHARSELDQLKPRVPRLSIVLTGATKGASVKLDQRVLDAWSDPIALDPGAHTVVATAPGNSALTRTIDVKEGERREIRFVLGALADPPPPVGGPPPVETPRGSIVPGVIALGLGAIGVGLGAGFGLASQAKVDELATRCPSKKGCRAADQPLADDARTFGSVSTVAFIAGGAGIAVGAILLVVRPGGARPPRARASALRLGVGPTGLFLSGEL